MADVMISSRVSAVAAYATSQESYSEGPIFYQFGSKRRDSGREFDTLFTNVCNELKERTDNTHQPGNYIPTISAFFAQRPLIKSS